MVSYIYRWQHTESLPEATQREGLLLGDTWFLDEATGISYEVMDQTEQNGILCQRVEQKPTNWVGSLFLERLVLPYVILKSNEKGVLVSHGSWRTLYWKDSERVPAPRDILGF